MQLRDLSYGEGFKESEFFSLPPVLVGVAVLVLIGEGFKEIGGLKETQKQVSRSPCFDWRRIQSGFIVKTSTASF